MGDLLFGMESELAVATKSADPRRYSRAQAVAFLLELVPQRLSHLQGL